MYGNNGCPCVCVSRLPLHALALTMTLGVQVILDDESIDEMAHLESLNGLRFEEFISTELTESLVGTEALEVSLS